MPNGSTILGTVREIRGNQVWVESPNEPRKHLRDLWVGRPSPMSKLANVKVGDSVKLEYFSTSSYGLWSIVEVL